MSEGISNKVKRRVVRNHADNPEKLAQVLKRPLSVQWDYNREQGRLSHNALRAQAMRYVRDTVRFLMPDLEGAARQTVALVEWPQGMGVSPSFEEVMSS